MSRPETASRPITSLLVANRGEIALRIFKTAREMGLRTIAVYADDDRDALFVLDADDARPLSGTTAAETYLDAGKVVAAALAAGAGGVHPGYGFLSEDAGFAQAVNDAGLVFVGPSPETISQMGDKPAAKARLSAAGVPTLESASVAPGDPRSWAAAGEHVGYPLLVKAAGGGGGRGMRLVEEPSLLEGAIEAASREAGSAFGRADVFLERYLAHARHVEVQVVADGHGNVVHLGDRDCSVQRRHQKVVEEAPAPGLGDGLRAEMAAAAVAGARAIGYLGVGTFEFLVDGDQFAFLEMNTRLQVEHPVTEAVTGLDLVRLQLEIACGQPLSVTQDEVAIAGHAIEARLYAEDPAAGWLPAPGPVVTWRPGRTPGLRWDSGVTAGSVVSPHFDSLVAKVVSHAPARAEAAARLARGLDELVVHGVRTNRDLLVALLRDADFVSGAPTTDFLERHGSLLATGPGPELARWHALAATLAELAAERRSTPVLAFAPPGWRNLASQLHERRWLGPTGACEVRYSMGRGGGGGGAGGAGDGAGAGGAGDGAAGTVTATVDGKRLDCRLLSWSPELVDLEGPLGRCRFAVVADGDRWYVDGGPGPHAHSTWAAVPRFVEPGGAVAAGGGVAAAIPGVVTGVAVSPGDRVAADDRLVVMEAMKMEHVIAAPSAAVVVEVHVEVGEQVEAHQVLVTLEVELDPGE